MRLYLSVQEAGVLVGCLSMAYSNSDDTDRDNIETLLKRIDVCLTLQGQSKGKEQGKKSKKRKKG